MNEGITNEDLAVNNALGPIHEGFQENCTGADEVVETEICKGPVSPVCTNVVPPIEFGRYLPPLQGGKTSSAFTELRNPNAVAVPVTAPNERVEPPHTAIGPDFVFEIGCFQLTSVTGPDSIVSGPEDTE